MFRWQILSSRNFCEDDTTLLKYARVLAIRKSTNLYDYIFDKVFTIFRLNYYHSKREKKNCFPSQYFRIKWVKKHNFLEFFRLYTERNTTTMRCLYFVNLLRTNWIFPLEASQLVFVYDRTQQPKWQTKNSNFFFYTLTVCFNAQKWKISIQCCTKELQLCCAFSCFISLRKNRSL